MRDYGDNLGGIRRAWIGKNTVTGILPNLSQIANTITTAQLDTLTELPLYPYRAGVTDTPQDTEQGLVYSRSFDTGIPSDSDEIREMIHTYQGWPVILIVLDIDGRYWALFDRKNPGKFLADFASGVNPSDGKMNTVRIGNSIPFARSLLTLNP